MSVQKTVFSEWLIKLGNGELTNSFNLPSDTIEIPPIFICKDCIIMGILGESIETANVDHFLKMAILCPKNSDVHTINEDVLTRLQGDLITYFSADSLDDESNADRQNYPIEFLNELTPSGMPNHKLNLKIGCIILLL